MQSEDVVGSALKPLKESPEERSVEMVAAGLLAVAAVLHGPPAVPVARASW